MYKYSTFSLLVESLLKVLHAHAVLGLRKFGACSAVSVGRLTLVEGGLVWLVKALVRTFFRILFWYAYENIHTKRYWNSCLYYLVEGGLVWRLVANTWAFVYGTFFLRINRLNVHTKIYWSNCSYCYYRPSV